MTDMPPPLLPDSAPTPAVVVTDPFEPFDEKLSCMGYVDALLKTPNRLHTDIQTGGAGAAFRAFAFWVSVGLLCYGLITGMFSGGWQYLWAPTKIMLCVTGTFLLCLPSLYIFSCLSGINVRPLQLMAHEMSGLALTSLLLLGLAPVLFLFSVSTESMVFMGGLHLLIWMMAGGAGAKRLLKSLHNLSGRSSAYLVLWLGIFVLVLLQMSSTLRPILGSSDQVFTSEKQFFLWHWFEGFGM
ncbi:hypothetical protein P3T73_02825 [Kiritimatiellota bacterium B12222]|nr:hypothetical protein P3T73_02825 [Kiritimatiellota bacterium B12222]